MVLIFVFVLTLVFGIIRIVNTAPHRVVTAAPASAVLTVDETAETTLTSIMTGPTDKFALAEDIAKLTIELLFTLLAIFATFALFRYVKAKYAAVPTRE